MEGTPDTTGKAQKLSKIMSFGSLRNSSKRIILAVIILVIIIVAAALALIANNQPKKTEKTNSTSKIVQGYREKLPELKAAVDREPKNVNRRFDYAVALYAVGNLEEAREQYVEATALNSKDAVLHNNLGNVYRDLKQYDQAVESYKSAIAQNATLKSAYINLASIQENQKSNRAEAIKVYQQALISLPGDSQLRMLLAFVYEREGNVAAAKQTLNEILKTEPNNATIKSHLDRMNKK